MSSLFGDGFAAAVYQRNGYNDGLAGKPPSFLVSMISVQWKKDAYNEGYQQGQAARLADVIAKK